MLPWYVVLGDICVWLCVVLCGMVVLGLYNGGMCAVLHGVVVVGVVFCFSILYCVDLRWFVM